MIQRGKRKLIRKSKFIEINKNLKIKTFKKPFFIHIFISVVYAFIHMQEKCNGFSVLRLIYIF